MDEHTKHYKADDFKHPGFYPVPNESFQDFSGRVRGSFYAGLITVIKPVNRLLQLLFWFGVLFTIGFGYQMVLNCVERTLDFMKALTLI